MKITRNVLIFFLFLMVFLSFHVSCRTCRETEREDREYLLREDSQVQIGRRVDSVVIVRERIDSVVVRDSVYIFVKGDSVVKHEWHWRERVKREKDTVREKSIDTLWRGRTRTIYKTRTITKTQYKDRIRSIGRIERMFWLIGVGWLILGCMRLMRRGGNLGG